MYARSANALYYKIATFGGGAMQIRQLSTIASKAREVKVHKETQNVESLLTVSSSIFHFMDYSLTMPDYRISGIHFC